MTKKFLSPNFKNILVILLCFSMFLFFGACQGNSDIKTENISTVEDDVDKNQDENIEDEENSGITDEDENGSFNDLIYDITTEEKHPSIDNMDAYLEWMLKNTDEEEKFLRKRWNRLVNIKQIHPSLPDSVIEAFLRTPREYFVRDYNLSKAYDPIWIVIEDGQTISGPNIVAHMTESINPQPHHKVLEIGMGSGYQSAILSRLSNYVYTIEIKENLFNVTDDIYKNLEEKYLMYKNVKRKNADGYYGWEEYAPFDRIIVTCGIDHIPPQLLKQLAVEGEMVIPIGPMTGQQVILKITKHVDDEGNITLEREDIYGGKITDKFVPFTATDGSWHTKNK